MLLAAQVAHAVAAMYWTNSQLFQGTTEALAAPRGKGAPAVRALLASTRVQEADSATMASLLSIGELGHLRVVQLYKCLGTSVLATGQHMADWASRANLANAMTGAKAKALFKYATFSVASRMS